jgi:hypothetical protein
LRKNRYSRGVNVIAMVLMLITFFLVIGFGIGALSTMNLNLSARSVNTVKANKLAEGAVAAFINYVETKSAQFNQVVPIDDMSFPPLNLDQWYNGSRNVFDPWKAYMGDNCTVDVHFNRPTGDHYYSTDNSGNRDPRSDGAYGYIPPFTIDLIITVKVGNFTKHYQVWISRKWDYAIYNQNGPVHLLQSYDMSIATPTPLHVSEIEGNVYSKFYPPSFSGHPEYLTAFELYNNEDHTVSQDFVIRNWIPSRNYPASTTVGARPYIKSLKVPPSPPSAAPVISFFPLPYSTGNSLKGRGSFEYPPPTPTPSPHIYVYPDNTVDTTRSNLFSQKLLSPFEHLKLIDPNDVPDCINQNTYTAYIDKVECLANDKAMNGGVGPFYTYEIINPNNCTNVSTPPPGSPPSDIDYYNQTLNTWHNSTDTKWAYFLKKSFTLSPTAGGHTKFVIRDPGDTHDYLPLVDKYAAGDIKDKSATSVWDSGVQKDEYGVEIGQWQIIEHKYEASREIKIYQPDDAPNTTLTLANTMIIARDDINLEIASILGDNALMQVEGNLFMRAGKLSAGQDIGAVIYCNNFYCGSNGDFKGVIMVKQSMKIGAPMNAGTTLHVKGGVAIKGDDPPPPVPPATSGIFDHGGLVATGFTIIYDPYFMRFLNRFGQFKIACWIDRD